MADAVDAPTTTPQGWGDIKSGTLFLRVYGEPVPKARPRVVNGRAYTPKGTVKAEHNIGWHVLAVAPGWPVDAEHMWSVDLTFWTNRTNTDLDNLIKLDLDALNGVVWRDDRQVASIQARLYRRSTTLPRIAPTVAPATSIRLQRLGVEGGG